MEKTLLSKNFIEAIKKARDALVTNNSTEVRLEKPFSDFSIVLNTNKDAKVFAKTSDILEGDTSDTSVICAFL